MTNHQEAQSDPTVSSDPRFTNRVVLVTGAAQGIGLAIVRKFLVEGAFVALNDLSISHVRTGLSHLKTFGDTRVMGCPADVTNATECQAMIDRIMAHWGQIDIAVNNAGIYPSHPVLEMTEENWDRVMDTNVKGMFLISQAVAKSMVAQNIQGQIINISSGSYHRGRVGSAHYCASKAAGVMFTRVLAMELAPYGIRVNAVAPGLIDTGLLEFDEAYIESTHRQIPAGRLGRPEDVAEAVMSLAVMATDYVTGAVLPVDGGLALGRYGIPVA